MLCSALFSLSLDRSYTLSIGHHFEPAPSIYIGSTTVLRNITIEESKFNILYTRTECTIMLYMYIAIMRFCDRVDVLIVVGTSSFHQ